MRNENKKIGWLASSAKTVAIILSACILILSGCGKTKTIFLPVMNDEHLTIEYNSDGTISSITTDSDYSYSFFYHPEMNRIDAFLNDEGERDLSIVYTCDDLGRPADGTVYIRSSINASFYLHHDYDEVSGCLVKIRIIPGPECILNWGWEEGEWGEFRYGFNDDYFGMNDLWSWDDESYEDDYEEPSFYSEVYGYNHYKTEDSKQYCTIFDCEMSAFEVEESDYDLEALLSIVDAIDLTLSAG